VLDDERVIHEHVSLLDLARKERASEVVVAPDDRRQSFPVADLLECKLAGINVIDLLEFLERETGRVKVELVSPSWMIFSDGFSQVGSARAQVRVFDLAVCSILLLAALPLMVIVALAILFDDGRPLFYRQQRVGLFGNTFELLKFRSMRPDAEASGEAVWATKSDDRATRVGRLLRKLRLDELPQLVNVLRGDMSLVGPRPERPAFVSDLIDHIPYYHERHCVKPGVTGWAQLCYPYGASNKDALAKLEYDLYYIKNRSLVFDLIILMQTAEVVLWQKGSR
jgi:sugar transferase (PEP-CTERM system associated)